MGISNTNTSWGWLTKLQHWAMAITIITTGIFMWHVNDSTWWFKSSPEIFITYIHWHKSLGMIALVLIVLRLWWRWRNPVPVTTKLTPAEEKWSHRVHVALYVLMVAVPITGWLSSSLFGSVTNFFGLFIIPAITPESRDLLDFAYWAHFGLAWAIMLLVAAHIVAALYHHFIRKDGVLRAMLPGGRGDTQDEDSASA